MKHYTQLSKEAQEEFERFEWEEKHRAGMAVIKLTVIGVAMLTGLIGMLL